MYGNIQSRISEVKYHSSQLYYKLNIRNKVCCPAISSHVHTTDGLAHFFWSCFWSVHCPITLRSGPHIQGVYSTARGKISWKILRKIFFCTSLMQLVYLFWSSETCFGERIGNLPQKKKTKRCYLALFITCHFILLHVLKEHMLDMLSTLCTVEGSSCSFNIPQAHIEVKLPRAVSMAWYLELSHMCQRALSLRSKGLGSMPQTLESLNCNSL